MQPIIKKYIDDWDNFIDGWYSNPTFSFQLNIQPWGYLKDKLVHNALPEPYCGDPDNFSAIILNLNPGGVTPSLQLHPNGLFIKAFKPHSTYWNFANKFPYLTNSYIGTTGGKWWNLRDQWIRRLINIKHYLFSLDKLPDNDKKPFGIDICPWHSKSWGGYNISSNGYVNIKVIQPAEIILQQAELKLVLCVGKDFTTIFPQLNFTPLLSMGPGTNNQHWPKKKNGTYINRFYSIWKSPNGIIYLNTYSPGTNSTPSPAFQSIETSLLGFIKNSGYNI